MTLTKDFDILYATVNDTRYFLTTTRRDAIINELFGISVIKSSYYGMKVVESFKNKKVVNKRQ
jgi:hypothetical protein